ncbi:AsmA family protein [Dechloromonas sp. A34]|uniref:AsmA family protein n=1 Tax=Dechloromonas sp. A34 TaxID=447588 RepID=UPI002249925F|nr:AsmA family protein [Dechloromonas sp. A34]
MTARHRFLWALPLLLIAAVVACEASGWFFLRAPAESILTSQMGREVRITAPLRLHFRRTIRLELGALWIAAPAEFSVPHLVDAQGLKLSLHYADLLALRRPTEPLRLAALAADYIDVRLIRLADGQASWQFASETTRPPPIVEHLGLQSGEIVLRDPTLTADLDARIGTRESEGSPAAVAEISGRLRERPLRASITLPDGLPRTQPEEGGEPIAAQGKADYGGLHLDFTGTVGADDFRGAVAIKGPSLSVLGRLFDTVLPTTAPFTLQGTVVKDSPVWQIAVTSARVGKSDLAGNFTYDTRSQPPRLDGRLTGRNFVLADLAPAFGTRNEDGAVVNPARGRTLPDRPLDLPALTRLDAGIAIDLEQVDLGSAFRQPISPLRAKLTLDGGRMTLSDIDASTAQGLLAGTLAIDASPTRPEWRADLGWDGVRLDNWLKAAKSAPDDIRRQATDQPPPPWFTGKLHGRTQLVGHGRSTAELLASLDGRTTIFVRDGSLSHLALEAMGLDVAQGLGLLLRGDDRQPVECAVIDLDARSGRMTPRVAMIATPVTVVMIDGNIDFVQEQLDLRLTAKPQNVSPLTLRTPLRVRGSFATPKLSADATPIAARAAGALGLALLNPLAAILPFVDLGVRDAATCSQALAGQVSGADRPPRRSSRPVEPPGANRDQMKQTQ